MLSSQLRAEFENVACLGAYEILLTHMGQTGTTPEALRSARINDFVKFMRHEESLKETRYANLVDPTLVYAYELTQKH